MLKEQLDALKLRSIADQKLKVLNESEEFTRPKGLGQFNSDTLREKLHADAVFLEHVYNEVIGDDRFKAKFDNLIVEAAEVAAKIYEDANMKPKFLTPVVEFALEPLSENEIVDHYKRIFNSILEESFNKPNANSEIIYEDAGNCAATKVVGPGVKGLILKCVKSGILDDNDPEAIVKYNAAENSVTDALGKVFFPKNTLNIAQNVADQEPAGYADIFGNSLTDNIATFKSIISKIGAVLAPYMFMKALNDANTNVPFNPANMAGISIPDDSDDNN